MTPDSFQIFFAKNKGMVNQKKNWLSHQQLNTANLLFLFRVSFVSYLQPKNIYFPKLSKSTTELKKKFTKTFYYLKCSHKSVCFRLLQYVCIANSFIEAVVTELPQHWFSTSASLDKKKLLQTLNVTNQCLQRKEWTRESSLHSKKIWTI